MPCLLAGNSSLLTLACISKVEANKQAPVEQTLDSAINRINHYPVDKYLGKPSCIIHWIEMYAVDTAIQLLNNWGLSTRHQSISTG